MLKFFQGLEEHFKEELSLIEIKLKSDKLTNQERTALLNRTWEITTKQKNIFKLFATT